MQKSKRLWFSMFSLLLAWLWLVSLSQVARADYDITNYTTTVAVQKDGSADVIQALTYAFDDDYHGVFNVQDLKGIQGAQFKNVTTQLNNGKLQTAQAATSGTNNTYQLSQNADRMRVKLYRTVRSGDRLRVTYRYRLLGVVTNYADTAELNWKVIGTGWDEPLENVRIVIKLPAKQITALQAWTHGPLSGNTRVDRATGQVTMTVAKNPANSFVESHLLFPTSVTATNQRTSPQKRLVAAQKQEAALAKAANEKRRRARHLRVTAWAVASIVWLAVLAAYAWWFTRHPANKHVRPIPINHSFDVPPVAPAVAESLVAAKSPDTNALTATILQAAAAKEIQITPVTAKHGRETVQLTMLKPVSNSFLAHCFETIGQDQTFTLKQLQQFGKRDKKGRLNKWFVKWQREIDQVVNNYQDEQNFSLRNRWLGAAIGLTILGAVAAGTAWLVTPWLGWLTSIVTVVAAIILWASWIIQRRKISINTDEGLVLINQISGLRRMLKDIGHFNIAEVGDLILWEQLLPYAAAFGLTKKVAAQLAIDFGTAALATGMLIYYPLFYGNNGQFFDLSGTLNNSFSGALSASSNASSPSGGSGGFSGGSSGGFGGGSGGGAF